MCVCVGRGRTGGIHHRFDRSTGILSHYISAMSPLQGLIMNSMKRLQVSLASRSTSGLNNTAREYSSKDWIDRFIITKLLIFPDFVGKIW